MSDDQQQEVPPPGDTGQPPAQDGQQQLGDPGKEALGQEREARKAAEKRSKELERELERVRQSSMTESEKAVAEAEARGRSAATQEYGMKLARTKFDALAGRRNAEYDTGKAIELLDLGKLLGEDGSPDDKAIAAAVEQIVPPPAGAPSFDGGARTPVAAASGMNDLIRKAAGRG